MNARYRTRPSSEFDLPAVLGVLSQNQAERPGGFLPAARQEPSDEQVAMWARIQRTPDVTVYLAESRGEAVVVTYEHRRRGVARQILTRVLEDARAAGRYKVQLLTHKRHATDGAHGLYKAMGFGPEAEGFRLYL